MKTFLLSSLAKEDFKTFLIYYFNLKSFFISHTLITYSIKAAPGDLQEQLINEPSSKAFIVNMIYYKKSYVENFKQTQNKQMN